MAEWPVVTGWPQPTHCTGASRLYANVQVNGSMPRSGIDRMSSSCSATGAVPAPARAEHYYAVGVLKDGFFHAITGLADGKQNHFELAPIELGDQTVVEQPDRVVVEIARQEADAEVFRVAVRCGSR